MAPLRQQMIGAMRQPGFSARTHHFGFLVNRCRRRKLACIRTAIAMADTTARTPAKGGRKGPEYPCPQRGQGRLRIISQLPRRRREAMLMTQRR